MSADRLYWASLAAYAVSLLLPAVIGTNSDPNMWGWQAFSLSLNPIAIVAWPSNLGYVAGALFQKLDLNRSAVVACAASVADMVFVAYIFLADRSTGGPIRPFYGYLGPGYFVWVVAGVTMLASAWRRVNTP
jgi:hypothetical protein